MDEQLQNTDPVPEATSGAGQYDPLLDLNADLSAHSVEAARVPEAVEPPLTAEDEARIDAALRERIPKPPLTSEDIAKLEAHRGQPVTQEQIAGINAARARGIDTSIV